MNLLQDPKDRKILSVLQEEFPLTSSPWDVIGAKIGLSGDEVLARIQNLQIQGIIRSISPILETKRIGFSASTLVAMRVHANDIPKVVSTINSYEEVSHNYQREHEYNIWFTITARGEDECEALVMKIAEQTGIAHEDILNLVTRERYKIDVRFRFDGDGTNG